MAPRFAVAMLAVMMLLAAAVVARQQRGGRGGTPNVILSVVVEVGESTVRVHSATAVRGAIRPISQQALVDAPRGPGQALFEYTAVSKSAPPGSAPFKSVFHVSFIPIVEESPIPAGVPFKPGKPAVVAIAMPDVPEDTIISFARLSPVVNVPPDQWARVPIGQALLPPVRR